MKIFYLFIILFYNISFSQVKVNTRKEIDIFFMDSFVSMKRYLNPNKPYQYKIVNNTDSNYIIDPQGFIGNTTLYECDRLYAFPDKSLPRGYYSREDEDCEQDFLILKKQDSILVELNLLNIKYYYDLNPNKKYKLNIISRHNEYTASLLGCNNYINNLKKQGYKVLEDSINIEIPLVP